MCGFEWEKNSAPQKPTKTYKSQISLLTGIYTGIPRDMRSKNKQDNILFIFLLNKKKTT